MSIKASSRNIEQITWSAPWWLLADHFYYLCLYFLHGLVTLVWQRNKLTLSTPSAATLWIVCIHYLSPQDGGQPAPSSGDGALKQVKGRLRREPRATRTQVQSFYPALSCSCVFALHSRPAGAGEAGLDRGRCFTVRQRQSEEGRRREED